MSVIRQRGCCCFFFFFGSPRIDSSVGALSSDMGNAFIEVLFVFGIVFGHRVKMECQFFNGLDSNEYLRENIHATSRHKKGVGDK